MSRTAYDHKFVKAFPDKLGEGILYVSVEFGTAAHLCFCGCGSEVYTRFSPRDWSMRFDGETVSLRPSIGNWSFPCQSHYVLSGGHVEWADLWSREKIEHGRAVDRKRKNRHFNGPAPVAPELAAVDDQAPRQRLLTRLGRWFLRR